MECFHTSDAQITAHSWYNTALGLNRLGLFVEKLNH